MDLSLMCFVWRWSVGALKCDLYGVKTKLKMALFE